MKAIIQLRTYKDNGQVTREYIEDIVGQHITWTDDKEKAKEFKHIKEAQRIIRKHNLFGGFNQMTKEEYQIEAFNIL